MTGSFLIRRATWTAVSTAGLLAWPSLGQATDAQTLALGKQLFTQAAVPACALCHTLADAGSEGAVGPVLDDLKPEASRVARALRNGIGQMPSYANSLSAAQIEALAQYVARASGASR